MNALRVPVVLLLGVLSVNSVSCQTKRVDRPPAVAGQFYPADRDELLEELRTAFVGAHLPKGGGAVLALIVPHAGYVFSGAVAASAYRQIDRQREIENVFVIGPSHNVGFEGASVYCAGDYETPLGKVKVNSVIGRQLVSKSPLFSDRTDAHAREHSVEVQMPFLQYWLQKEFRVVPIVVGQNSPKVSREIADLLRPYLTSRNLFVISTDFSHYPAYGVAKRIDRECAEAIARNSPEALVSVLQKQEEARIPGLATSMCGWSAVLTLSFMTEGESRFSYDLVEYRNSGDVAVGSKDQVVGYYAIALREGTEAKSPRFELGEADRLELLKLARRSIGEYLASGRKVEVDPRTLSPTLKTPCGAFVTLTRNHDLRGCVGRFDASEPLYHVVQEMAVAAATEDYRFTPVTEAEMKGLDLEVSVLTPLRRIESPDQFELGTHGIYIRKGNRSGTFLPQVAKETGWTKEEFLGHCAQDKAGIGWDGWKDAELYVYEAIVFGEREMSGGDR